MSVNLILKRDLANFLIMFSLFLTHIGINLPPNIHSKTKKMKFLKPTTGFSYFVRSIEYWMIFILYYLGRLLLHSTFHWNLHLIYHIFFSIFQHILPSIFLLLSFTFNIHFSLELNVWYPFIYWWCAESSSVNLSLLFQQQQQHSIYFVKKNKVKFCWLPFEFLVFLCLLWGEVRFKRGETMK